MSISFTITILLNSYTTDSITSSRNNLSNILKYKLPLSGLYQASILKPLGITLLSQKISSNIYLYIVLILGVLLLLL